MKKRILIALFFSALVAAAMVMHGCGHGTSNPTTEIVGSTS